MNIPGSLIPADERQDLPEKEYPSDSPQKIDDSNIPEFPKEEDEPSTPSKSDEEETEDEEEEGEEQPRVPQKRVDRLVFEREEARRELSESNKRVDKLADLLEKATTALTTTQQAKVERTTPDKWKKILGEDNPLTDEFYALLDDEMTAREQRAAQTAIEQWEKRQTEQSQITEQRTEVLRNDSEVFAKAIGVDPSTEEGDKVLADILDIQDELTPSKDGKYTQPLIPLQVAHEVYKARMATATNPQKQRRLQASGAVSTGRGDVDVPRNVQKGRPDPSGWRKIFNS